jgi:hypothetical protein
MKESRLAPAVATVVLLLLPLLYLGCYLVLMTPVLHSSSGGYVRKPEYRFGGSAARCLFYPATLVDRQVRPDFWDELIVFDFGF